MGGLGSGRTGWKPKAENLFSIDSNRLSHSGCLHSGYQGAWCWRDGDTRIAEIDLETIGNFLTLSYLIKSTSLQTYEMVTQHVPIGRLPCRFGGHRAYFLCPGVRGHERCGRRVVKLFWLQHHFLCRHCHHVSYASQSETRMYRLLRKVDKLRSALGAEPRRSSPLPERPKGMWEATWERRMDALIQAEVEAEAEVSIVELRMLDKLDPAWRDRRKR